MTHFYSTWFRCNDCQLGQARHGNAKRCDGCGGRNMVVVCKCDHPLPFDNGMNRCQHCRYILDWGRARDERRVDEKLALMIEDIVAARD